MSHDIDILTPADQAPGNVVRVPSKRLPIYSALLIWNRAEGQPTWSPISAPSPGPVVAERIYVMGDYFLAEYVR